MQAFTIIMRSVMLRAIKASGYSEEVLIGAPHNMLRHPDMPPEAFADLWDTIKGGSPWIGIALNWKHSMWGSIA